MDQNHSERPGRPGDPASTPTSSGALTGVPWTLVLGLGALALIRPLMSATGISAAIGAPWAQLGVTLTVSVVWIASVVATRAPRPVLTLVLTGVAYGVFVIVLSAVLSPFVTGELQGPVANPFGLVSVLATNALWGVVAGGVALAISAGRRGGTSSN
ncbi:hypothetical protein [Nocardiopsis oceani]